jgi:hypothetical protein
MQVEADLRRTWLAEKAEQIATFQSCCKGAFGRRSRIAD